MLENAPKYDIENDNTLNIPVVFACDNNYVQHLGVCIASILANKKTHENLSFYVLNDDITDVNKEKLLSVKSVAPCNIEFVKINAADFDKCAISEETKRLSIATYFRFVLPRIFPDFDKMLYLDCDINVTTSLSELFNTDIEDYYAGVVSDCQEKNNSERLGLQRYFNAGMMLVNPKKWRVDNIEEKAFDYSQKHKSELLMNDQDVLNVVLQDKLLFVDLKWNVQTAEDSVCKSDYDFNSIAKHPGIIHFITCYKPWSVVNNSPNKKIYFEYLKLTPWKNKMLLYKLYSIRSFIHYFRKSLIDLRWNRREKRIRILSFEYDFIRKNHPNNENNIKLLVCYHKKDKLFKNDMFVPIHCGRALALAASKDGKISKEDYEWLIKNMIGDDTGNNISELNREINEMTAIYWAWKNYDKLGNPDYIGLNHYRRFFPLSEEKIKILLDKYDFISSTYYIEKDINLYKQWQDLDFDWADNEFLDVALEKCKTFDSENGEKIEQYFKSNIIGPWCNMFILSREDFFKYCDFIFPLVFEVLKIPHKGRAIGMFAERLTGFYLYNLAKSKNAYFVEPNYIGNKINNMLQQIFSMNNKYINLTKYKIVTILGLKIKIKKEKV